MQKKINNSKLRQFTIYILMLISALILSFNIIEYLNVAKQDSSKSNLFIGLMMGIILLILEIKNLTKNYKNMHHIFLSLIIPIGAFYIIAIPPNMTSDETAHMNRAYAISTGHILAERDEDNYLIIKIPNDLLESKEYSTNYASLLKKIKTKTNYNDIVIAPIDESTAGTYSSFSYIGSSIGILIGRTLKLNIFLTYYLARIFNFIIAITIIYFAIKIIPNFKCFILLYSLTPMFIQQISCVSADTIINAIAIFLIAFVLYLKYTKKAFDRKDKIIYIVICLLLASIKYTYLPMIFLIFILDKSIIIKDKKNRNFVIILMIISFVVAGFLYVFKSSYFLSHEISTLAGINTNVGEQLKYILNNPFKYMSVFVNTLFENGEFYYFTFLGRNLGTYTITNNSFLMIILSFVLFSSLFIMKEKKEIVLDKKDKIVFILITIFVVCLIETGLYMLWNAVGSNTIEGVHGRYFIPILLLPLMMFRSEKISVETKYAQYIMIIMVVLIQAYVMLTILRYFNVM